MRSFLSTAAGIAVALALTRGFARRGSETIGDFWVDTTRAALYVLPPICILASLIMAWQGVPQTFSELGTATSSGARNAIHDSYLPLGGLVFLGNTMLDEVIIGGPCVGVLLGVSVTVGGFTDLPALALGPVAEHTAMPHGTAF